jgi:hypothetical protein
MSIVGENSGMYMPVAPAYGAGGMNNGFGWGDGSFWIIILFLFMFSNGWGGFGGYGGGGMMPWMMSNTTNNDVQRGFDQQAVMGGLNGIQAGINSLAQGQCAGLAGVNTTVNSVGNSINSNLTNGFYNAETAAANRQMASMQQNWAAQTAVDARLDSLAMNQQQGFCENRAATADVKYAIAQDGAATRSNTDAKVQMVMDKLCQLELDGVKQNYESKIANMQQNYENRMYAMQGQIDQLAGQVNNANRDVALANEVDALYNRMKNCPVPSMPVYGTTPIFTCGGNQGMAGCCGGMM